MMKKTLSKLLVVSSLFLLSMSYSASAQVYVSVRPTIPVVVRPVQPSPAHVWIDEEWEPYGTSYRYVGGHWDVPPHPGYHYYKGYWRRHGHDGEEWVRGGWRK